MLRDYEAAWRDGDGPRLAALFMEDGFAVQSGSPIRRGRMAIAAGITKPGGALQLTAYAYSSSGNVGYIIGGYRYPNTVGLRRPLRARAAKRSRRPLADRRRSR